MGSETAVDISVALAPCDLETVPNLLNDIKSTGERLSHNDRGARLELLEKARGLVQALETPRETMIKHCWAQPANYAALAFGVQTDLFTSLAQELVVPKKVDALAVELAVDDDLLCRMMRHIGAMGYIQQTGPDESKATNFSKSLTIPIIYAGYTGFIGHDLDEFHNKFPEAPGKLVLQDLPKVIGQITELNPKIERQSDDFHEEQPVKGARAHYMHSILHDWPDETCVKIVERIKQAMKPGYSKILINENVIAPTGAAWEATGLDLLMLTLFSARERAESDWR